MFLITVLTEKKLTEKQAGFNPLNQVYVFNAACAAQEITVQEITRFNPLNQVYVFNDMNGCCRGFKFEVGF